MLKSSQREGSAESRLAPALTAVLGAPPNDGFSGAFGDAATDRQVTGAEGHITHPVLVVREIDEVLPK